MRNNNVGWKYWEPFMVFLAMSLLAFPKILYPWDYDDYTLAEKILTSLFWTVTMIVPSLVLLLDFSAKK